MYVCDINISYNNKDIEGLLKLSATYLCFNSVCVNKQEKRKNTWYML